KGVFYIMRLLKSFFIALICCLGASFYNSAFAGCEEDKIDPGNYCLTSRIYPCRAGCWCEGAADGQPYHALDQSGNGMANISDGNVKNWCLNGTSCAWSGSGTQCGTSDAAKIYKCPLSYPSSADNATKKEDCYTNVVCSAGYYVEYDSPDCNVDCPRGNYCPGGSVEAYYHRAANLISCPTSIPSGYSYINVSANPKWTRIEDCEIRKKVPNCDSGYLLRKGKTGGSWGSVQYENIKLKKGYKLNIDGDNTKCEVCGSGYYNDGSNSLCNQCSKPSSLSSWSTGTVVSDTDHTVTTTASSWEQCYIYGTPQNCTSGTVRKYYSHYEGSGKVAYSDTKFEITVPLVPKTGYYVNEKIGQCVTCKGNDYVDYYVDGNQCKKCPGIPSGAVYYKENSNAVNDGIENCRYGINPDHCEKKYGGYAVIYKYKGSALTGKYELDPEKPVSANVNSYVKDDKVSCATCASFDSNKAFSDGGEIDSSKCYSCEPGSCIDNNGVCQTCSAGFACPANTTTGKAQNCKYCPASNCEISTSYYGVDGCGLSGNKYSYSEEGAVKCSSCGNGTMLDIYDKDNNKDGLFEKECSGNTTDNLKSCYCNVNGETYYAILDDIVQACVSKPKQICINGINANTCFSWPGLKKITKK
nr:hypothetical protein [Candidatus Enterousia merdequi]